MKQLTPRGIAGFRELCAGFIDFRSEVVCKGKKRAICREL